MNSSVNTWMDDMHALHLIKFIILLLQYSSLITLCICHLKFSAFRIGSIQKPAGVYSNKFWENGKIGIFPGADHTEI